MTDLGAYSVVPQSYGIQCAQVPFVRAMPPRSGNVIPIRGVTK